MQTHRVENLNRKRFPLRTFNVLTSCDPDMALVSMRQRQPGLRNLRPAHGPNWHLVSNAFQLGAVTIVASSSGGYSIDLVPDRHVRFFFPLSGNLILSAQNRVFESLNKSEGFLMPYSSGTMKFLPDSGVALVTARNAAVAEAMRLLECEIDPAVLADRYKGEQPAGGLFDFRKRMLHEVSEIDDLPRQIVQLDRFRKSKDEVMLLAIADVLTRYAAGRSGSTSPKSRILRSAQEYVEAFWSDDFSYVELATHTGASLRTVQTAFRRELGATISAYVRDRRLKAARERLSRRGEAQSVSAVAEAVGYFHLGRFSADYFVTFGERPSETLRRKR